MSRNRKGEAPEASRIDHLEVPEVGADEVREAADLHRHHLPHPSPRALETAAGGLRMPRRGLGFLGFAVPPASTAAACGGGVRRRRAAAAVSTGGEGDKGRSLLPCGLI